MSTDCESPVIAISITHETPYGKWRSYIRSHPATKTLGTPVVLKAANFLKESDLDTHTIAELDMVAVSGVVDAVRERFPLGQYLKLGTTIRELHAGKS